MNNDILVKVGADISGLARGMKEATSKMSEFANKNQQTFDAFKQVGAGFTAVGAGIAAGLGGTVKVAAQFDTTMRKAGAIAGATSEEFNAMKAAAIELGASTSKSAGEVAEAMTDMASKGYNATQIIAAMPGVIAASEASGEALALTADTVSSALNVWGIEAGEAGRVADVLAQSANNSAAGIDSLSYVIKYAGAPAAALGVSLEELASAAGIMADAGLDGSNAGTSLRASLLALNNPAKAQEKIMERLGFSMRDSEGNAKTLALMVDDLAKATEHMTEADKVATLGKLVGTEAVSGFLALMKAGPDVINANTTALENSAGASAEAAEKMMGGIGGALEEMSGAFESAAILIGDQLVPFVMSFAQTIAGLTEKFNQASPAFQKIVVLGTALAGALALVIGPIMLMIGFIPQIIAGFGAVSTVFTALTGPIGLTIAAITGVVAALVLAYNKVEWFRNMIDAAWASIKDFTVKAFNGVKETVTKVLKDVLSFGKDILGKFRAFWDENGKAIMALVSTHFNNILAKIKLVMGLIKGVFEIVWPIISNVVKIAWELIKTIVSTAIDIVLGVIRTVMKVLQGDWKGAWNSIKDTATTIMDNIVGFFKAIDLVQVGKDIIAGLIRGIGSMASAVTDTVKNIASNITGGIKDFLGIRSPSRVMMQVGRFVGEGLSVGMHTQLRDIKAAASSMADAAVVAPQIAGYTAPNHVPMARVSGVSEVITGGDTVNIDNITIDAKTVGEFNGVVDFVNRLRQETRKR
ncbi:phage tail tape measure protein [Sporosarcina sp. OR05]|uniref:phage tail tape measure protein n=1 Tax=Sporosarcina sp. OR05 TaxID=2969819 RepID=UPI00352BB330